MRRYLMVAAVLLLPCLWLGRVVAEPPPPPRPERAPSCRVERLEKGELEVTFYNAGDSLDRPSGAKQKFVVDTKTKFLNIIRKEVEDPDQRAKLFAKGQIVVVVGEKVDDKLKAREIQLVGG